MDSSSVPSDELTLVVDEDCKVYGMPYAALFLCVKDVEGGIIGGTFCIAEIANLSVECVSNRCRLRIQLPG
jgi:hypothetical protein